MQVPEMSEALKAAAQVFSKALTETLTDACSSSWQVDLADEASGTLPETSTAAWFQCSFEGSYPGDALLAFPSTVLPMLALRDVPLDAPDLQVAQTAKLLTSLKQCLAKLGASLDEAGSTSVRIEELDGHMLTDERVIELSIESNPKDPAKKMSLHLCLSQQLLAGLQASSAEPFVFPDAAGSEGANLNLVMGVELNVTLRFGQRQLALREVLDLTSGSVVELDRQVDEPVELILDGRVVARGEAVIIDGNYGMRVTQLMPHPLL